MLEGRLYGSAPVSPLDAVKLWKSCWEEVVETRLVLCGLATDHLADVVRVADDKYKVARHSDADHPGVLDAQVVEALNHVPP